MNLVRIDEFVEGSEPDRVYLTEVAKRMDALWGHVRDEGAVGPAVGFLSITRLVFRDGFKINDGLDINNILNIAMAAAVMAAVWDWMDLDWKGMEHRYWAPKEEHRPFSKWDNALDALASGHPSVVLVHGKAARWPHWLPPEQPPLVESKTAMRRRRHRLRVPGGIWRLFAQIKSGPVHIENQGTLKELVVGDWLHVEHVEDGVWWMRVGDMRVFVVASRGDRPLVDVERGFYGRVEGDTTVIEDSFSPEVASEGDGGGGRGGEE
ncbi:hypothetical protein [Corallococcus exiguus]|uniref:Uncharacterized protein n=1 Tax=Corallococcus exiguus TaxID=83462 RepID=A0A7X4YCA2_9BACT|nr:hypothetical protein [Corallococcus exiguus]NBC42828.1 hypothetical protein [Corallococcus exiguus]TNV66522.1 hypothetical protein FH620_05620 [Corallococcus exiguus]